MFHLFVQNAHVSACRQMQVDEGALSVQLNSWDFNSQKLKLVELQWFAEPGRRLEDQQVHDVGVSELDPVEPNGISKVQRLDLEHFEWHIRTNIMHSL